MFSGFMSRWMSGGCIRCMWARASQIFAPHAATCGDRKRLRPRLVEQSQQVAPRNELDDQVGGPAVLDEVVQPGHDRHVLKGPQDLRLAAEEGAAQIELLRVGGDHLLDRDRLAGGRVRRLVDHAEPAGRQRLVDAVLAGDQLAGRSGQRAVAPLAKPLARRVQCPADRVRRRR